MPDRSKGILFALLGVLLYGLVPVLGRIAVVHFHPLFVAFVVNFFAGLWLLGILIIKRESPKFFRKETLWIVAVGLFAAAGSLFSFTGLSVGRAIDAGFFFQFGIFFTAILGFIFLKEKLLIGQVKGLFLMFAGAIIFTALSFESLNKGVLLFLAASFVWSINDIIVRGKRKTFSPFLIAFGRNLVSSIFLLPFAYSHLGSTLPILRVSDSIYFILYGATVAGIILFGYLALKYLKAAEAVSFQVLIPIITTLIAFVFLQERLMTHQIIGGIVILLGLSFVIRKSEK